MELRASGHIKLLFVFSAFFFVFTSGLYLFCEDSDPHSGLEQVIAKLRETSSPEIWELITEVNKYGVPGQERVIEVIDKLKPVGQLACAKFLWEKGLTDDSGIVLLRIARQSDLLSRRNAADLLGNLGIITVKEKTSEKNFVIADELNKIAEATEDTTLQIALAKNIWRLANREERQIGAHKILVNHLSDENIQVRRQAAFALAELYGTQPLPDAARNILLSLENVPTSEGRKANLLLLVSRIFENEVRETKFIGSRAAPLLEELRERIQKFYVDEKFIGDRALIESAAKGMVRNLDRFSSYLPPAEWKQFRQEMSGQYAGIGASIIQSKGRLLVQKVFYTGPAYKAGLRTLDEIVSVDDVTIKGNNVNDVVKKLRGAPGSSVLIRIRRKTVKSLVTVNVIREKIYIPTVQFRPLPGNLGYLRLFSFGDKSKSEVKEALAELAEKQKISGLVLDLRDNPGGLLTAAQGVADLFLDSGKVVVFSKGRNLEVAPKQELRTSEDNNAFLLPLVVLVNGKSASAAEILSGALQDHKRAKLVGQRTYGKGSVQQLMPLKTTNGTSALKLTIAKYYLPSGRSIHEIGIEPDIMVHQKEASLRVLEQLAKFDRDPFHDYYLSHVTSSAELLNKLCENDEKQWKRYPGFEKWYSGLKTELSKKNVRLRLRGELRGFLADVHGKEYICDIVEDEQLQRAITVLAKILDINLFDYGFYKGIEE